MRRSVHIYCVLWYTIQLYSTVLLTVLSFVLYCLLLVPIRADLNITAKFTWHPKLGCILWTDIFIRSFTQWSMIKLFVINSLCQDRFCSPHFWVVVISSPVSNISLMLITGGVTTALMFVAEVAVSVPFTCAEQLRSNKQARCIKMWSTNQTVNVQCCVNMGLGSKRILQIEGLRKNSSQLSSSKEAYSDRSNHQNHQGEMTWEIKEAAKTNLANPVLTARPHPHNYPLTKWAGQPKNLQGLKFWQAQPQQDKVPGVPGFHRCPCQHLWTPDSEAYRLWTLEQPSQVFEACAGCFMTNKYVLKYFPPTPQILYTPWPIGFNLLVLLLSHYKPRKQLTQLDVQIRHLLSQFIHLPT